MLFGTQAERDAYRGPVALTSQLMVATKDSQSNFAWRVNATDVFGGLAEARQIAESRAETSGLPIYEIGPDSDPAKVLADAVDCIVVIHQCSVNGTVTRDPAKFANFYSNDRLEAIAAKMPPLADD